jgi:hypothetical protein
MHQRLSTCFASSPPNTPLLASLSSLSDSVADVLVRPPKSAAPISSSRFLVSTPSSSAHWVVVEAVMKVATALTVSPSAVCPGQSEMTHLSRHVWLWVTSASVIHARVAMALSIAPPRPVLQPLSSIWLSIRPADDLMLMSMKVAASKAASRYVWLDVISKRFAPTLSRIQALCLT